MVYECQILTTSYSHMEHIIDFLFKQASIINIFWWSTIACSLLILIVSIYYPFSKLAKQFPLTIMFSPKVNLDLQSVGYAMMHSTWLGRISHYTIFWDAFFWFVICSCVHWSLSLVLLLLMVYQGIKIGEASFTRAFVGMGIVYFVLSLITVKYLNGGASGAIFTSPAWLISVVVLMLGGIIRFVGHFREHAPPLLLDDTDKFVKLNFKSANSKLFLVSFYGYVAEFASGLPSRLFAVQVNYFNQNLFRIKPKKLESWNKVYTQAQDVLKNGYKKDERLRDYYNNINMAGKVR